jgi:MaoC dehydratase-like protein
VIDVPIDRRYIGFRLPAFTVPVTTEGIRRFAEAIGLVGELDYSAAPPTYMKIIEGEGSSSRAIVSALQIDLRRVLHIEQQF